MAANSNAAATISAQIDSLNAALDQITGIPGYEEDPDAAALSSGNSQVADGAKKLSEGSNTLLSGTKNLKKGTADLRDGISELSDGTDELRDGTQEFYDKTYDMDTQTQDTIDDMIASISGDDTAPVSFASAKNADVKAVQFVIKTTAIEKSEAPAAVEEETGSTGFWQKLVQLFHKN